MMSVSSEKSVGDYCKEIIEASMEGKVNRTMRIRDRRHGRIIILLPFRPWRTQ